MAMSPKERRQRQSRRKQQAAWKRNPYRIRKVGNSAFARRYQGQQARKPRGGAAEA